MTNEKNDHAGQLVKASAISFDGFGLPEAMLTTLKREGLTKPTPIQAMAIPLLLEGKDLIGLAQTGTGKTAAFLLPLMTQLGYSPAVRSGQPPKALILAPTRELANQILQNVAELSADLNMRHIAVFGGARYDAQIRGLRRGADIVVATPGRLEDLMDRGAFDPSGITHFVLDEADHMLDLGFYPPIKRIAGSLPRVHQTMLFSATMPPEIEKLANEFLSNPAHVKAPQTGITADNVVQRVTLMPESDKRDQLCDVLNERKTGQALIFVRTKRRADVLAKFMSVRGFAIDALHGDMRQTQRQKVLRNFRSGELRALIATDVAARGIDVAALSHVINFDITDTPEAYVHRIGRTGRAGLGGIAISFCAPDEQHKLSAIVKAVGSRVEIFNFDGTPVSDFKSSAPQSRGRRRPQQGGRRNDRVNSPSSFSGKPKHSRGSSRPVIQTSHSSHSEKVAINDKPKHSVRNGRGTHTERRQSLHQNEKNNFNDKPRARNEHTHNESSAGHDNQSGRSHLGDRPKRDGRMGPSTRPTDRPSRGKWAHEDSRLERNSNKKVKPQSNNDNRPKRVIQEDSHPSNTVEKNKKPFAGKNPFKIKPKSEKRSPSSDRPRKTVSGNSKPSSNASHQDGKPKKRPPSIERRATRNAIPQGGQGNLKRRR